MDDKDLPTTLFPDNVPFYHWQEAAGQGNACLVHTMDLHGDSGFAYCPLHCDGLVLLPTDTKLYVFNPGTGDVLNLPEGQKSRGYAQAAGLGLDLGTNTYKVAHFFYRSVDYSKRTYNAGMELFTIGGNGSCWRIVEDPPYPVIMPQEPAYFKGSLYWHVERELLQTPLQGFLRFDLEEETFGFISHPVLPSDEQPLQFTELGGELCLVQQLPTEIVFWTSLSSGDNHQWHRVYVINNLPKVCKALRFLGDCVFLQSGARIYRHDKATGTTKEVASVDQLRYKNPRTGNLDFVGKDRYFIFIIPYTESLVPLPRAR